MEIKCTPHFIMRNFTLDQLILFYGRIKQVQFDLCELQARLVWAIANGWEKPKTLDESVNKLTSLGVFEDTV